MIHSKLPVPTGSLWWMELNAILRLARSAPPVGVYWQLVVDGAQCRPPTCQFSPSCWRPSSCWSPVYWILVIAGVGPAVVGF